MRVNLSTLVGYCNPAILYVEDGSLETLRERVARTKSSAGILVALFSRNPERYNHFTRIKWLMENGWQEPVSIDVGIPSLGYTPEWMIEDGNHRTTAALLLGHETIEIKFSGTVSYFEELFMPGTV